MIIVTIKSPKKNAPRRRTYKITKTVARDGFEPSVYGL